MQRNGKFIEWSHIRGLYKKLQEMATTSSGLTLLPKLKYEHVYLTSMSKMRVDLAAQVICICVLVGKRVYIICLE